VRFIGPLILSLTAVAVAAAQGPRTPPRAPDLVRTFLIERVGFSGGDLEGLNAGRAVVKVVDTHHAEEVSLFGAVRMNAPIATYLERLKNIEQFEQGAGVLEIGKFHTPPQPADLHALTLDDADMWGLEDCRPGDCDVQLSAAAMARFKASGAAAGDGEQANRIEREVVFDYLTTYLRGGQEALGSLDDHTPSISIAREFEALVTSATLMPVEVPGLVAYLRGYPAARLPGSEDFFYWAKFSFGLKPTIRLNHVTIHPLQNRADGLRCVIATTQIHATHYFSTTLELRFLFDDPARPGNGFFLLASTQSRCHGFTGMIGGIIKSVVKRRARTGLETYLNYTKQAVEAR
jgi:hypothetical protein